MNDARPSSRQALVYLSALMLQDALAEPAWRDILADEDLRGLTPLFWAHVSPYGVFRLEMDRRINRANPPADGEQARRKSVNGS